MTDSRSDFAAAIRRGIPDGLPPYPPADDTVSHAPARPLTLSAAEQVLAVQNALRYFPPALHAALAPEFAAELRTAGRIYMRRFRPHYAMHARPLADYPARCPEAAAIMLMIQNNLDPAVAQHPHELITYGGNGTVFQNWAQYLLTMRYLAELTDEQTLVLYSGHPLGLFPAPRSGPRVVVTNGLVVPNYSRPDDYQRMAALGVTSYGQMTAGSFMYIGPQGIVHGTTLTLLAAGRRYLGLRGAADLAGRVFVTAGLGGMSGAQGKAARIAGAVGVIAEIDPQAVEKRLQQGWIDEVETDLERVLRRVERARRAAAPLALAYLGNVVDLWERLAAADVAVDLGSDQTSLHLPFSGGYYPVGLSLAESRALLRADPAAFKDAVQTSLRRQVTAIDALAQRGMAFWDYGNAFLLEAGRAGAAVFADGGSYRFPSYVEDLMGPLCFDLGFGPFRWVCTSGAPEDLATTDAIAAEILAQFAATAGPDTREQWLDNLRWIREAQQNRLVVGSQARILYCDAAGRVALAAAFNAAIAAGRVRAPIVLGRDHHDTGGTDSPYRETANIRDGSRFTADMAVHNMVGDAFRGATWVSLHNGGGVGFGEAINGGFGLLLDGSADAGGRAGRMLAWDVWNGVARRAWARNAPARSAIERAMAATPGLRVTLPFEADEALVRTALSGDSG